MIGTLLFIVAYFAVAQDDRVLHPVHRRPSMLRTSLLGLSLGVSLFCIGARRGPLGQDADARRGGRRVPARRCAAPTRPGAGRGRRCLAEGGAASGIGRRPLIKYTLGGALGLFALPLVLQLAGDLGPLPGDELSTTLWEQGHCAGARPRAARRSRRPTSRSARSSTSCPRASTRTERRPRAEGQGRRPADAARPERHQERQGAATGATRASSPTPRSAPTSAARSACTSSRRTTCCARATSRPST